jgi:DNA helicase-2/ATP-dependent DNA helicase PcrA
MDTGLSALSSYFFMNCLDRKTGVLDAEKASKHGFSRDPKRHQSMALSLRLALLKQGIVDFDDARDIANANLQDADFSARLAAVLSSRFKEVIVDEAQDCNPDDLTIITWLRDVAKIPTKVVCDPNQSIYGFRGGVSSELFDFSDTFADEDKLPLTGNFRSTDQICKVVHALRAPSIRGDCDTALGELANNQVAVHIISYAGKGVSPEIGKTFAQLAAKNSIQIDACRVVAKTRNSGINAVGGFVDDGKNHLCLRIARAAKNFQHATLVEHQLKAVIEAHKISLELSGFLADRSYHQVLEENGLDDLDWRGQIIATLKRLHFDVADGNTRQEWVARARAENLPHLQDTGRTISQKIQNKSELDAILQANPIPKLSPSTIHEVKGKQFIGVCVVLTTRKTKAILAHLTDEPDQVAAEDCREFYVAASRARQFLAIACPKSQLSKLTDHLELFGSIVEVVSI